MVSKNNFKHKMQDEAKRVPHYGLRKLSVGVASVLLSTTLFFGVSAHADTTNTDTQPSTDETSQESNAAGIANQSANSVTLSDTTANDNQTKVKNNSGTTDQTSVKQDNEAQAVKSNASSENQKETTILKQSKATSGQLSDESDVKFSLNNPVTTYSTDQLSTEAVAVNSKAENEKTPKVNFVDQDTGKTVGNWVGDPAKVGETVSYVVALDYIPDGYGIVKQNINLNGSVPVTNDELPTETVYVRKLNNFYLARKVTEHKPNGENKVIIQYVQYRAIQRKGTLGLINGNVFLGAYFILYASRTGYSVDGGDITYNNLDNGNGGFVTDQTNWPDQTLSKIDVDSFDGYKTDIKGDDLGQLNVSKPENTDGLQSLPKLKGYDVYLFKNTDVYYIHQKTVKRTIEVTDPQGKVNTTEQIATLIQTPNIDTSTGKVTSYSPWKLTENNWKEFDTPSISGYTPSQAKVEAFTPDGSTNDTTIKINYSNTQNVAIKFIDNDNGNKQVGDSIVEKGSVGKTITDFSNVALPAGYELANGQKLPTSYTFTDNPDQTIKINLVHKKITVNGNNPLKDGAKTSTGAIINGAHKDDLSKNYVRQIGVYTPDKKLNKITQEVTLTRSATYDDVNGKVTYNNDWTTGKFDKYSAQDIAGYKTGKPAPEETVNYTPDEQEAKFFIIRYTPLDQSGYISYVDNSDGHEVGTSSLSGKTGESVTVTPTAPAGWEIVQGQDIPKNVTATADGIQTVTVKVQHKTTTVTPDTPKDQIPSGPVPGNPDKPYPSVDQKTELTKTITRTINVTKPDGTKLTPVVQTVTYTRNALLDHVTGEKSYTDWTTTKGSWDSYTAPEVAGYKAPSAAGKDVSVDTSDTTVNLTYTANNQTGKISYVDNGDGHEVGTTPLSGKTDQSVTVTPTAPAGWEIVQGQKIPSTVTATANGIKTVTVKVQHTITTVTPKTPKDEIPTGPVPGNPDKPYPSVDQKTELTKTITRTINVTKPDGTKLTPVVQTVTYTRNALLDHVTGEKSYTDWTTTKGSWDSYTAPEVAGYKAPSAAGKDVPVDTSDTTVNLTYTANNQTGKISYVDNGDGHEVGTTPLSGKTDQSVTVTPTAPAGWEIVQGQKIPSIVTATANGIKTVTVKVKHKTTTVTPDMPKDKIPTGPLPGDSNKPYPTVDQTSELTKTITRTINVTDPQGKKTTTTQTVTFKRNVTIDEVTGGKTYSDWTTDNSSWDAFTATEIPGYTADKTVAGKTVDVDTPNETVDINYTANDQTGKISYVDKDDGHEVGNSSLSGKTGESVTVTPTAPAGWEVVPGQDIPKNVTATADGVPTVTVKVQHKTTTVTPDTPKDQIPTGPLPGDPNTNYPGVDQTSELTKTITRTINVTDPQGKKTTTTQTVTFKRNVTIDEVTGDKSYSKWTTDNDSWDDFSAPEVKGYTADKTVAGKTVDVDTPNETVDINYTANDQTGKISYVDKDDSHEVGTSSLSGKTGELVTVTPTAPAGWEVVPGQDIPKNVTATADGVPTVTVKVQHGTHAVTPDNPAKPGDKTPTGKVINGGHETDLTKTITRTINVTNPSGKTTTTTQTAHLTRTGTVDDVTGEVTYTPWTTDNTSWTEVDVPSVPGYTPSQKHVDAATVDINTQSQTININYTLDPTNTASNDHVSDQTTNGQNATNGAASTTATPSNDVAGTQSNNQEKQLPQTGNKHSSMAALGLGLMSFLGLYGFHKKEDED